MRSGIYCWNRKGALLPPDPKLPSASRYQMAPKRHYFRRTPVHSGRPPTSSISSALKIVSKYRLCRQLPCSRTAKLYSPNVSSAFIGRSKPKHLKLVNVRSRYGLPRNVLCSRYKFRRHRSISSLPQSPAAIRLSRQRQRAHANASLLAANRLLKNTKANLWRQKNRHTLERRKECLFFNKYGRCARGEKCPFQHNPDSVPICTKFLLGKCQDDVCRFRHVYSRDQLPVCQFYRKGACKSVLCPYSHTEGAGGAAKHHETRGRQADPTFNDAAGAGSRVTRARRRNDQLTNESGSKKWASHSSRHSSSRAPHGHAIKYKKWRTKKSHRPTTCESGDVPAYIRVPNVHESDDQAGSDSEVLLSDRPIVISDIIPPMIHLPENIRVLVQEKEQREKKRQEALDHSKQARMKKNKLLRKRTRKGQPALGLQIEYLLPKIEKQHAAEK